VTNQNGADDAARTDAPFADRYGPWALVAGASDGVGAAFARQVAERGLNVVLLARRQQVLDEVAAEIRDAFGVETRALAVDLVDDGASASIIGATRSILPPQLGWCHCLALEAAGIAARCEVVGG